MTTPRALQTTLSQHALALTLAAVVTFGVLAGLVGEAGGERATELAQQLRPLPHAIASALVAPQA
jgi:hypothetical protein